MDERMVSIPEAAFILKVPYRTAYDLALSGRLKMNRVGRRWAIPISDVYRLGGILRAAGSSIEKFIAGET